MPITLQSPSLSETTIIHSTAQGNFGKAHNKIHQMAKNLSNSNNYALSGQGFENRGNKFINTIGSFARLGASLGAGASAVAMLPADAVTGRGGLQDPGMNEQYMDHGVIGYVGRASSAVISGVVEVGGMGAGAVVGAITLPAKAGTTQTSNDWIGESAQHGGDLAGKPTALHFGTTTGIGLDIVRLPSLGVKYATTAVGAVVGGTIGFFAAIPRAILNA